jgi:hypothetical protein
MKLYEEKELSDFLYEMYVNFGDGSVRKFVKDRQDNQQLLHIKWQDCDACEIEQPVEEVTCLVCGSEV